MMRFGAIGWGLRASVARAAHDPERGRCLEALADPDPDAHARFRASIGNDRATTVTDYRDLIGRGLDAIFVLSPDHLHEEMAVTLLEAGESVFLEKPMAITVKGCDRILAAARASRGKLYVGHNMRHFQVIRAMREAILAGKIGNVKTAWTRHFISYGGEAYFRDWHADRRNTTGLLLQKGAHDLDVLHWLCGGYSRRVTAMGKLMVYGDLTDRQTPGERVPLQFFAHWPPTRLTKLYPVTDVEDVNTVLMELDNGVLATYQQCHFTPDAWRNTTVIGDAGRIENFGDSPGEAVIKIWNAKSGGYREPDEVIEIPPATGGHGGSDELMLEEFFRALRGEKNIDNDPVAARMAVAAGVAATTSVRNGSVPVDVAQLA